MEVLSMKYALALENKLNYNFEIDKKMNLVQRIDALNQKLDYEIVKIKGARMIPVARLEGMMRLKDMLKILGQIVDQDRYHINFINAEVGKVVAKKDCINELSELIEAGCLEKYGKLCFERMTKHRLDFSFSNGYKATWEIVESLA
jgi:dihydroxyacetone kinase-like predicted kinase